MTETMQSLGFIGTGLMGKPMVYRLLNAGFKVNVWNRSPEKLLDLTFSGAKAFDLIEQLVAASEVIILCLKDTEVVADVVLNHILSSGRAGQLVIDLSSIDPQKTRDLAVVLNEKCGMCWVDAPVSGGVSGAEQGSLAIMAGGAENDVNIARTILAPLYKQLTYMGAVGTGQITKICNQMIVSCNVMVIAEMTALAQSAGVNAEKIAGALAGGFADSKPLQILVPEMATETFEPIKWRVQTLLKDLNMAQTLAEKQGNSIPMSDLAADLMQCHAANGYAEQDPATLIKLYGAKDA